jgi:SpoVK/Ycf46/Vps4 family AAA+-type ATPase
VIHRGSESFQQLGGLENLKAFCLRAMRRQGEGQPNNRPRGVLLLSPPGCGKSQFAKALGNETGRPTVVLDVGALLGSLVGQSESNVRAALKLADAMAPCVLFADEIEKALAGATSSGQSTAARCQRRRSAPAMVGPDQTVGWLTVTATHAHTLLETVPEQCRFVVQRLRETPPLRGRGHRRGPLNEDAIQAVITGRSPADRSWRVPA